MFIDFMKPTSETFDLIRSDCRIVDANGLEWKDVRKCDTETGDIWYHRRDENNNLVMEEIDEELAIDDSSFYEIIDGIPLPMPREFTFTSRQQPKLFHDKTAAPLRLF